MQFRNLPSVDSVLATSEVAQAAVDFSRDWVVGLVREELEQARTRIRQGDEASGLEEVASLVCRRVDEAMRAEPRRVINATGVVIHTNLGRAPLSRAAMQAAEEAAQGYSNLEFDLESGRRGSRQAQLELLLRQITGAEAALAVNNNASALLLGLQGPGTRAGSHRFPRRGRGDWRRFSGARRAASERLRPGGRRDDQPHLPSRLRGRHE